ncbi:MAG TPA: pilus assembly protein TadG-related protein [Dehalococcoidia bacterium]|nr:pilus assembly protein TadG-related protein [Dehalococcoidia bacterium]
MRHRLRKHELGQALPILALLVLVILGLAGLAADVGKVLIVRAELGRDADAAALAGAKQLPNTANAATMAKAYLTANDADPSINVNVYANGSAQQVRVVATKSVNTIFMRVFGIKTFTVQNEATAGFGTIPVDAVLGMDATGSMSQSPCSGGLDTTTPGCPIKEAKDAAKIFVNTLLPSIATQVGENPYRGCYNPPDRYSRCIPTSLFVPLTTNVSTLTSSIMAIDGSGGSGTNVCLGLYQSDLTLFGAGHSTAPNTRRYIILLTDGSNIYNSAAYVAGSSPPAACRPTTSPQTSDTYLGTGCTAPGNPPVSPWNPGPTAEAHQRQVDTETVTEANSLKAAGVEIYIVGLGVCGTEDGQLPSAAYCASIGNIDPSTIAAQRLLKCIASSSAGTNDHYYTTSDPTQLSGIFGKIAQNIAFRLIK